MKRVACLGIVLATLAAPVDAGAAVFFLFDRPSAAENDRITVRTGVTPRAFTEDQRVRPFQRAIRLYLVRNDTIAVRTRFDSRVYFVGSIVPDKKWRGVLRFSVPPLDEGTYTIAYWCPACGRFSRGRTFAVQRPRQFLPRFRSQALLRLTATESCPVTLPNGNIPPRQPRHVSWYGNGLLWAGLSPDGVYAVSPDRVAGDGSIGNKLLWVTTPRNRAPAVSGVRLDAPASALRVLGVNRGSFSGTTDPSFMTPVSFPSAGCWRVRARVGDISLVYVVRVAVRS
jgi:hypothetical protein